MVQGQVEAVRPLEPRRTAIIIGASSGIGAALARRLAREGYHLGLVARRSDLLDRLCEEINAAGGAHAWAYVHDVRDSEEVPALLQRITRDLGGLDLFIYVAGVQYPSDPDSYDPEGDRHILQVNVEGAVTWLNPVAYRFKQAGRGHIVGIGSIAGDRGRRGFPAYSASKAALHTYLEGLRNRISRHGVRVTTIKPGQVQTDMLANADRVRNPISPERAADLIWRAIRAGRQVAYVPPRWALVALVVRNIPSFIFRRMNL